MKNLFIGILLFSTTWVVQAETVLICHGQSVPAVLETQFHSPVSSTLVEMVFDYLFQRGDIAFDTIFPEKADPSAAWLGALTQRFGADKVVYFQVYWKTGPTQEAQLDHISYQLVGEQGQILKSGSLTSALVTPSQEEWATTKILGQKLVASIAN